MKDPVARALAGAALLLVTLAITPVGSAIENAVAPGPNTVGTAQLKKNAVTGPKVKDKSLTGADIADRSLTGADLRAGTLRASNFAGGQLPRGLKGDKGDKGEKGDKGPAGPNGLVRAFVTPTPQDGIYRPVTSGNVVSLALPAGRYAIFGRVLIGNKTSLPRPVRFYALCTLTAGNDSDYNQVAGENLDIIPANMQLIHEFSGSGVATISCSKQPGMETTWARARITAVEITPA
jgi:hypothetical protein